MQISFQGRRRDTPARCLQNANQLTTRPAPRGWPSSFGPPLYCLGREKRAEVLKPRLSSLLVLASKSALVTSRVLHVTVVAAAIRRVRIVRESVVAAHRAVAAGPGSGVASQLGHNLGGCSRRIVGLIERSCTGNVRRGHARARDRVVPAVLPGGVDAHAWGGDGVILVGGKGSIVAEGGRVVILLAGAAARRCSLSSRNAIRIAHRRDGQHLAVRCGHEVLEVGVTVPRGDCVSDARGYGVADGPVVCVACARAISTTAAEAHVGHSKVDTRVSVPASVFKLGFAARHPVYALDDPGLESYTAVVKHLYSVELCPRSNANGSIVVV